jgi:hypothetical protein
MRACSCRGSGVDERMAEGILEVVPVGSMRWISGIKGVQLHATFSIDS